MKKLLLIPVVLVLIVVVAVLTMSGDWAMSRTHVINAPAAKINAVVEDLSTWPEWSYWSLEVDPEAEFEFSGPEGGAGCTWTWTSDGELGSGTMVVASSSVAEGMIYDLTSEGMKIRGTLSYKQVEGGTEVTFAGEGTTEGLMKLFTPLIDMIVGPFYEQSLTGLEEYVLALPASGAAEAIQIPVDAANFEK